MKPVHYDNWEVVFEISVGSNDRIGADGMAFWYSQTPGQMGPVFGSIDNFVGLGVFLDTFDNDGKRDNPSVYAVFNPEDNPKDFDFKSDGGSDVLGRCRFYFRSNPYSKPRHVKVKVTYLNQKLSILTDGSGRETSWTDCFSDVPIVLPKGYYFGFSAETGTAADFHDIYSFQAHLLLKPGEEIEKEEQKNENPDAFF